MKDLHIEPRGPGVRIAVRVQPRASRDAVAGVHDGALKVQLTAPPTEGKANAALVRLLAKKLGTSKGKVRIVGGAKSRHKTIELDGLDVDTVRAALS